MASKMAGAVATLLCVALWGCGDFEGAGTFTGSPDDGAPACVDPGWECTLDMRLTWAVPTGDDYIPWAHPSTVADEAPGPEHLLRRAMCTPDKDSAEVYDWVISYHPSGQVQTSARWTVNEAGDRIETDIGCKDGYEYAHRRVVTNATTGETTTEEWPVNRPD